jgi:hypothetical protein
MDVMDAPFLTSLAGVTASSAGVEGDLADFPSLSMTDVPLPPIIIDYATSQSGDKFNLDRLVWLWRRRNPSEWSGLYTIRELPASIGEEIQKLHGDKSDTELYTIVDTIADWVAGASASEQGALSKEISKLPVNSLRILLSGLADSEVTLTSQRLLYAISGFVGSGDKRIAQSATVCLLQCGDALGGALLRTRLNNPATLPHAQLIVGAIKLLASE